MSTFQGYLIVYNSTLFIFVYNCQTFSLVTVYEIVSTYCSDCGHSQLTSGFVDIETLDKDDGTRL
jgi:hypothetical protein